MNSFKYVWRYLILGTALIVPCAVSYAQASVAEVRVMINQHSFQYILEQKNLEQTDSGSASLAPRLSDILAPVALTDNWYWPAAMLYQQNDKTAQHLQAAVLQQLATLKQHYITDSKLHQALSSMLQQVQSWQVATRILIPIDYDFARIRAVMNPRFTAGNYLLQLYTRPKQISVFGLVQQPGALAHKNAADVTEYVSDISFLDVADTSTIYVLQPDGRIIKATIAAWQQQHIEAMPGAQLFVPFQPALFSKKWQQLNLDILALARHRIFYEG